MENTIDRENKQQVMAYELIANTNSSFFLTGRAGTGKTTFLRKVQQMVDKQFITLAPTGVAAILAGGDTIHSFFGLPMDVCTPGTMGKMSEARILTLLHTDDFFFYKADVIKRMRLVKIEFQKVYRQEDEDFLHILENVRLNMSPC